MYIGEKLLLVVRKTLTASMLEVQNKKLTEEIEKLKSERKWMEYIPLLGEFFRHLRHLKIDSIRVVMEECIAVCLQEEEYIRKQEQDVDDIITNATKRSELTGKDKQSIKDKLFEYYGD